jgi:hypothetical protein
MSQSHTPISLHHEKKKLERDNKKGGRERRGGRVGRREGVMPNNMNILQKIRMYVRIE